MDAKTQAIHVRMAGKHGRTRRLPKETMQSSEHNAAESAQLFDSPSRVVSWSAAMFTSPGQFQWPATARWQDAIV
jgi:hypothetical protein